MVKHNPLRRRHLRTLRSEFGKYLVIFLLLVFTIGLISGFLVADGSMIIAYNESFEKYNMEDGNFRTDEEISRDNRRDIEAYGVRLYDNFYLEKKTGEDNTLRVFQLRDEVNLLCLMRGQLPQASGEMALDRMYADNNGIKVGDQIRFNRRDYTVTGLVAFPDYSALFQNNNDAMFDAIKFGVAAVTKEDFDQFTSDELEWCYSWKYTDEMLAKARGAAEEDRSVQDSHKESGKSSAGADNEPDAADAADAADTANTADADQRESADGSGSRTSGGVVKTPATGRLTREEEKILSDELMENIADEVYLEDFLPGYLNQAIQFTGEDMGGDRAMMLILLYIVIVIIAFVFVITTGDTIAKESAVIGTLRATGCTRMELVRHYMALPVIVTLAAALAGNILGYTWLKDVCAGMYYGSYSLPTYVTVWNGEAFVLTTVVPCIIMLVTTFCTLWSRFSLSPLQFLRRELRRRGRSRALPLNRHIPFPVRFRLRIFFQNIGNYAILLIGIFFANVLLLFGMALPVVLDRYQASMQDNMLCKYQYFLASPAFRMDKDYEIDKILMSTLSRLTSMTSSPDAEPFTTYSLQIPEGEALRVENITVYGVKKDSRYVKAPIARGKIWISSAYADKLRKKTGDTIRLKEPYENKYYEFTVDGIYDYMGGLCMFMRSEDLTKTFNLFDDYVGGYFSDTEITDLSRDSIATIIDYDALIKISRQLDVSMGGMMIVVDVFAVALFMILLYLLSRIIIEKNAHPISMTKILGYSDGEIARLYILTTSIVTLVMLAVTIPGADSLMHFIFQYYLAARMSGWITYDIPASLYRQMFLIGAATYLAVALFEIRKIRAIPMTDALKDVV